jgi:tetratricopeptide (TPR) repeat protein
VSVRTLVFLIAFSLAAFGQRHKVVDDIDAQKPDGKLLQSILQESDTTKKIALLEQFAQEFPKNESTQWALDQLLAAYVKANEPDKILTVGERVLSLDPTDPEAPLQCLKAAEAKKDLAGVKKWADLTSTNARKLAAAPQPKEPDQVESWKQEVEYAKQVDAYTDYALFRAAAESRDPKITIDFAETLEKHNPKSEYIPKVHTALFTAYRQAQANDRAIALAERVLETDQSNEDMLLVVADNYLQAKKSPDKVHAYSAKIVEVMASKPKPEGVADADWAARRTLVTGIAHYMNGKLYHGENNFAKADVELRAALPLVESNQMMKAETLYLLALSNFKLEKPQEAANYFRACAAIKSPYQQLATTNLARVKTQYTGIK